MNKEKENKNAEISARIAEILQYTGDTRNGFAVKLGYERAQTVYDVMNMKSAPSYDFFRRFSLSEYSDTIDLKWLLSGEGSMLRSDQPAQVSYEPTIGVPYYDVDFIAGFDQIFNDQTLLPAHNVVFKPFEKATLWCNVTGHSMEQKINHGDIIALKECTIDDVQYGEIYAVVLDTIRTVKILRKSEDPHKFRYVPVNKAEYDDQDFDKSRIIKIYEVLGNISKFF